MKYNRKNWSIITLSTALVFLLSGCIIDDTSTNALGQTTTVSSPTIDIEPSDEMVAEATIYGKVTDIAGDPLSGVTVTSEKGTQAETDNTGYYTMKVPLDTFSITASFKNYTQNGRAVNPEENASIMVDLVLKPVDKVIRFDSTTGIQTSVKGASVTIPDDALVTTDGTPYEGEVHMTFSYNHVTSTPGARVFPGDYTGIALDGSRSNIRSYGFIEVTLEGSNGEALNLAKDKNASITYPLDTNIVDLKKETPPASIPLWYYDTEKGSWVEEGVANYDQTTNTYTGTVNHFTVWNLDAKFDGAQFSGCVEDINGNRVTDTYLTVSTPGWIKRKHNIDSNGKFTFINAPSNTTMELYAISGDKASAPIEVILDPGENRTLDKCLVLDQNSSLVNMEIHGRVVGSNGDPLSSAYIYIYSTDHQYLGSVSVDLDGYFKSQILSRTSDNKVIIMIYSQNISVEKTYLLDADHVVSDIGTIVLQTMSISGCVERPDGNRTFTGETAIHIGTPYGKWGGTIKEDGTFKLLVEQSNTVENFYFFTDMQYTQDDRYNQYYSYTKDISLYTDQDTLTINSCIVLDNAQALNQAVHISISSSEPEHYINIIRNQYLDTTYPETWGEILLGHKECSSTQTTGYQCTVTDATKDTTYTLVDNAVYYINVASTSWDKPVSGNVELTLDNQVYSITIPTDQDTGTIWVAFAIEVYQGTYTVHIINKSGFTGEEAR